jgi:hypothetical protein
MNKMNFEDIFGEDSKDYFDKIIEKYGLKPQYKVYQNEKDEVIVDEEWISPDTESVKANRIFKLDVFFLDLIREESRMEVLKKSLELYISVEDYENAALVRDIIQIY